MTYVMVGFVVFTLAWVILFVRHFHKIPPRAPDSANNTRRSQGRLLALSECQPVRRPFFGVRRFIAALQVQAIPLNFPRSPAPTTRHPEGPQLPEFTANIVGPIEVIAEFHSK